MRFDYLHNFGETFRILRMKRDMHIGIHVKYALFLSVLMNFEFSRQIFENHSSIKFHENSSSGSLAVPCRRTDRRDEANSRFSQFCERAKN
jgi:hypothetical protein